MKILFILGVFIIHVNNDPLIIKAKFIDNYGDPQYCGIHSYFIDYRFIALNNNYLALHNDTIIVRIYCPKDVLEQPLIINNIYTLTLEINKKNNDSIKTYNLLDIKDN